MADRNVKVYYLNTVPYVHIADASYLTHRSMQSFRHLIAEGNSIRAMKFYRDRSRLLIPVAELLGFPFRTAVQTKTGTIPADGQGAYMIYHYGSNADETWRSVECEQCSRGEECPLAQKARLLSNTKDGSWDYGDA